MVGIDGSAKMLDECRRRADRAGVLASLTLHKADFRDFALDLDEGAELVAIPYHAFGHLVIADDRARALATIRAPLVPGGRLVFDALNYRAELSFVQSGIPQPISEYQNAAGDDVILWSGP